MQDMMMEMEDEMLGKCPDCGGSGTVSRFNDNQHPCSHCASERMRGEVPKGNDTRYHGIMPELK